MEAALTLWTVILTVGALNYFSRLSFIAVFAKRSIPPLLARALRYVPAAMLTALILPMVADVSAEGAVSWSAPKIAAATLATAVAYATKSSPKTLIAGMAALWLLQWLVP
ncbi:MAG: AzlD domain-containing protein [Burkholderiales bacterium]|nr:AzlD domain-containing protein [Burkholderiales bacterium]